MKKSLTGSNLEPLTKIHPVLLGKQKVSGARLLPLRQQDGNVQLQHISEQAHTVHLPSYDTETKDEITSCLPEITTENTTTATDKAVIYRKALVPGLTLYVPDPTWEAEAEHNHVASELGGYHVLTIAESCYRSKITFVFDTVWNGSSFTLSLIVGDEVLASSTGNDFQSLRGDIARQVVGRPRDHQVVVYKPLEEKPLRWGESVEGLILFFECPGKLESGKHYEVIVRSCERCKLEVQWWETTKYNSTNNNNDNDNDICSSSSNNSSNTSSTNTSNNTGNTSNGNINKNNGINNNSNNSNNDNLGKSCWAKSIILTIANRAISVGEGYSSESALNDCAEKALEKLTESNHPFLFESELSLDFMADIEAMAATKNEGSSSHSTMEDISNNNSSNNSSSNNNGSSTCDKVKIDSSDGPSILKSGDRNTLISNSSFHATDGDFRVDGSNGNLHTKVVGLGAMYTDHRMTERKLNETNIGHRLLRKMGWSGNGGVGRNENGIADSIEANRQISRRGLGQGPWEPPKKMQKLRMNNVNTSSSTASGDELVPGFVLQVPSKDWGSRYHKLNPKMKKKYIVNSCQAMNWDLKVTLNKTRNCDLGMSLNDSTKLVGKVAFDLFIANTLVATGEAANINDAIMDAYARSYDVLVSRQPVVHVQNNRENSGPTKDVSLVSNPAYSTSTLTYPHPSSSIPISNQMGAIPALKSELIPGLILLIPPKETIVCLESLRYPFREGIIRDSCVHYGKSLDVEWINEHAMGKGEERHFRFDLFVDRIFVAAGEGRYKRTAITNAFNNSYNRLKLTQSIRTEISPTLVACMSRGMIVTPSLRVAPGRTVINAGMRKTEESVQNAGKTTNQPTSDLMENQPHSKFGSRRGSPEGPEPSSLESIDLTSEDPLDDQPDPTANTIPGLVLHLQVGTSADVVLIHSCHLSNADLQIVDSDSDNGRVCDDTVHCAKVLINGVIVAYGFGASSPSATIDAAENALRLLVENGQPTLGEEGKLGEETYASMVRVSLP